MAEAIELIEQVKNRPVNRGRTVYYVLNTERIAFQFSLRTISVKNLLDKFFFPLADKPEASANVLIIEYLNASLIFSFALLVTFKSIS